MNFYCINDLNNGFSYFLITILSKNNLNIKNFNINILKLFL